MDFLIHGSQNLLQGGGSSQITLDNVGKNIRHPISNDFLKFMKYIYFI